MSDVQREDAASRSVRRIAVEPTSELLKAGRIVGLDPREMTAVALDRLVEES